jgi:hypothetical protein
MCLLHVTRGRKQDATQQEEMGSAKMEKGCSDVKSMRGCGKVVKGRNTFVVF